MDKAINNEIRSIVNSITAAVPASKIILFGSLTSGQAGPDSDIDLCVLTEDDRRSIDILQEIRAAIYHIANHPVDVIVYKSSDFYDRAGLSTTFENKILHDGLSVYE
jgi:predicted nucleotidyltransferase